MNRFYIIIFIINIFHIYSAKFITHKNAPNNTIELITRNSRSLLNQNNLKINNNGYISVLPSIEGLYTLNISIGTPSQEFSLILDTCSSLLWINNDDCFGCKSQNKFISSQSDSFILSNNTININYLSGETNGTICIDTINFNNITLKDYNFLLVNETNLDYAIEGIFGLSKGAKNIQNSEYSTLNQIQKNNIIKKNIFLFDFSKNSFYIGEIPQYLNNYNKFTCEGGGEKRFNNYYWNCNFQKLKFNNNENLIITDINNIIFDSGTNCLIFPIKFILEFEKIISDNKLLNNCSITSVDLNNNISSLICNNNISNLVNEKSKEYKKIFSKDEFMTLYFNNNKKIFLKLNDLYNQNEDSFKIYFTSTPNNAIILGVPFFEKYTILFNKDNNQITFYEENNNNIEKNNLFLKILTGIFIAIIVIFIFLLICFIIKRKMNANSKEIEKKFSKYGMLEQESKL